ncbi:Zn-ribbon domain-containing OB-fold protein [Pseudonocardia humida]|uniref:OB-fold domain-containing protein n=1 Tax=Pseudonocardia humida TaxID=2800819 RepID=A0ABT1AC96_9PSEU|nr:OB-fold domain-containing protein [Pseudonocardia humida]MCO1660419.1 OB-fold domain-containing protein [Pseudonocardia humida]
MSGDAGSSPAAVGAFPRVERDAAGAGFFDAAARGELLLRRAGDGRLLGPQDDAEARTGSADLAPVVASGRATLVSWAVVHQAPLPWLAGAVPYVCAVVELAEGPWLTVRLVDADPGALAAGQPLRVRFVPSGPPDGPGETLPVFAPA